MTTVIEKENNNNIPPSYDNFRRILLLGEADFSFTIAFAKNSIECRPTSKDVDTCGAATSIINNSMEITATEYGSATDIANRYYDGDIIHFQKSITSIQNMPLVNEIICGLNARILGNIDDCPCQKWNAEKQEWENISQFWHRNDETENRNDRKFDLIIFNFPHSDQAGRAAKLVRALFKQLRICIRDERLSPSVVLEMRLRTLESDPKLRKNVRASYNHLEAAEESQFKLIGCWDSDLDRWEKFGYQHKWTRRNASCRDLIESCKVWRWTFK